MAVELLLCGFCGGPLPRPGPGARFVTCRFCEATSDLHTGERTASADPVRLASVSERFMAEFKAFEKAFSDRLSANEAAVPAFRAAAESTLAALADADAITNVAFGIAGDFYTEKHVDVTRDPLAMQRVAMAYLGSLEDLAAKSESTINLPFLTATRQGPLHFQQDITMTRLRELAATPASVPEPEPEPEPEPPPPPPPAPPEPPRKKKPWWKKMLG